MFLGSPHGRRRMLAGMSGGRSRVRQTAVVFPIGKNWYAEVKLRNDAIENRTSVEDQDKDCDPAFLDKVCPVLELLFP